MCVSSIHSIILRSACMKTNEQIWLSTELKAITEFCQLSFLFVAVPVTDRQGSKFPVTAHFSFRACFSSHCQFSCWIDRDHNITFDWSGHIHYSSISNSTLFQHVMNCMALKVRVAFCVNQTLFAVTPCVECCIDSKTTEDLMRQVQMSGICAIITLLLASE